MSHTFSANEVVAQVEGLNTIKTLNRWRKVVEEHFGMNYFNQSNSDDRPYTIRYSPNDVKHFQSVAFILSGQASNHKNLQRAIVTAFSSDEPFVKKKTEIEILQDAIRHKVADLEKEDQRLYYAIGEINRKLMNLENQLSEVKDRKQKLFRRK